MLLLLLFTSFSFIGTPVAQANNRFGPTLAAWVANDLVGTGHRFGGSDPATGLDNSGLVFHVFRHLGVDMPRTLSAQTGVGTFVPKSDLQPGDLVFFRNYQTSRPVHVGIYVGGGDFVASASQTGGVVRRSLSARYYVDNYLGARRVAVSEYQPFFDLVGGVAANSVGIPFRAGGSSADGADTVGFIHYVFRHFYLPLPNTIAELARTGNFINASNLRSGDLVFFRNDTSSQPSHVGIYIGNNQFVASAGSLGGSVVRSLRDSYYARNYLGARRPPGVPQESAAIQPVAPAPVAPAPSAADLLIREAETFLGAPYRLGANGPEAFDCSGYTRYLYRQQGVLLPRTAASQATVGTHVAHSNLRKGDLVFFRNTWRNDGSIDHVAIYMGDGRIIHAITRGVSITPLSGYWQQHYASARRVLP